MLRLRILHRCPVHAPVLPDPAGSLVQVGVPERDCGAGQHRGVHAVPRVRRLPPVAARWLHARELIVREQGPVDLCGVLGETVPRVRDLQGPGVPGARVPAVPRRLSGHGADDGQTGQWPDVPRMPAVQAAPRRSVPTSVQLQTCSPLVRQAHQGNIHLDQREDLPRM